MTTYRIKLSMVTVHNSQHSPGRALAGIHKVPGIPPAGSEGKLVGSDVGRGARVVLAGVVVVGRFSAVASCRKKKSSE